MWFQRTHFDEENILSFVICITRSKLNQDLRSILFASDDINLESEKQQLGIDPCNLNLKKFIKVKWPLKYTEALALFSTG